MNFTVNSPTADNHRLKNRLPLFSLLLLVLLGAPLSAQVVINEIQESGTIELKNVGTGTVDVSNYWLCDFPSYRRLGSGGTNIIAGDLMLGPGEILAIDNFNVVSAADGEMGLYTSSAFGSSDAMIDYVEWGSTGHGRSSVAVAAGIWQTGLFVPAFAANQSLAYTGTGDGVDAWIAGIPTIGADNNTTAQCDIVTNDITLDDGTTTNVPICVDGNPDPLTVLTNGGTGGTNVATGWIITDAATGEILGTPAAGPFDLDGAGVGTCNIYYVRWEMGDFGGNTAGNNIDDLTGCFDLSNPIVVYRQAPDGGTVALADGSTTTTQTAGNVIVEVTHTTAANFLSYWYIITDDQDNILGWANSANTNTLDLSDAPAGTCRIWGWSYRGLDDPIVGDNISTLNDDDCEAISSNWVTVIREAAANCDIVTNDITLDDGTTTNVPICVDGNPDPLTVLTNGGTGGTNVATGWIITDAATGEILGTPAAGPFDLDGAGVGTCNIYYVRWEMGDFGGNTAGNNIDDLTGCFDLSNPIVVYRQAPDGGTVALADGSTTTTQTAGNVIVEVTHTTAANFLSYWYIITDDQDNILGWANSANTNTLDLSDAPAGTCRIWGWSYRGLDDPIVGDNISTLNDDDCEAISDNWIAIIRQPADCDIITNDIALADGSTETSICVDGNPDPIALGGNGGTGGVNVQVGWIITDAATGEILGLPAAGPFDLDGAGPGTCNIYYVRWEMGMFGGNVVGNNIADLTGCFSLSNPVAVIREIPDGGTVALADGSTAATFDAGNVVFEMAFETTAPNLSYWYIITDDQNEILGFQNSRTSDTLDLSPAPAGVCRIWGWSYRGLDDPIVGDNISTLNDDDCEAISSNWVTITREDATGTLERPTVNALETFPNPFVEQLTIRAADIERVELYDALGKAVRVPIRIDPASAELETGGLAPGLYLLRVATPEGIFVETVIHR